MSPPARSHVLMTADAVGGVWTYALDLARGLAGFGVRTTLVVMGPAPGADQQAEAAGVRGLELIETGLPLDWTASEYAEIGESAAAVRGLARGLKVDLVHLNSPALAAGGGYHAPVLGACHSCLATWWSAVRDGPLPEDFRWRTQALWQGLIACDALIAPSAAFARDTARTYDVPRPYVVHNGRTPSFIDAKPRERAVFTAGRLWDAGKNIEVLDRAAARLAAPLLAAGPLESPTGDRVQLSHAQALGRLTQDEVSERLAARPVFASAALYEPFGLAVLEAAQAGCALVLSDIPTFRELWEDAAVFAPADDADAFAEALQSVLDDPGRAAALGAAARKRSRRYTVEALTTGVLEIYRTLKPEAFLPVMTEAAE